MASLEDNKAKINAIAFSENGYYVASGAEDGVVKVCVCKLPRGPKHANLGWRPCLLR